MPVLAVPLARRQIEPRGPLRLGPERARRRRARRRPEARDEQCRVNPLISHRVDSIRRVEQKQRERGRPGRAPRGERSDVTLDHPRRCSASPSDSRLRPERRRARPSFSTKSRSRPARERLEPSAPLPAKRSSTAPPSRSAPSEVECREERLAHAVGRGTRVAPGARRGGGPSSAPAMILIRCSPTPTRRRTCANSRAVADGPAASRSGRLHRSRGVRRAPARSARDR